VVPRIKSTAAHLKHVAALDSDNRIAVASVSTRTSEQNRL
jgi:hypothetical protein